MTLENFNPSRVRAADCTKCSKSLYRLLSQLPPLGVMFRVLLFLQYSYVEVNANFDGLVI